MIDPPQSSTSADALLLHGSADSPACWRGVVAALQGQLQCAVPPLPAVLGAGPDAPALRHDMAWLGAELDRCGARILAAHSYGALVALHWAQENPGRLDRLLLAEPIAWGIAHGDPAIDHVLHRLDREFLAAVRSGENDAAMTMLVDYWNGPGFWARLPARVRDGLLAGISRTAAEVASGRLDATTDAAMRALDVPLVMVMGSETTAESAIVTRALAAATPGACLLVCAGAGHQMLRSHSAEVAAALLA